MNTASSTTPGTAFALPEHLHAKHDPRLTAADDAHFARIAASIARDTTDVTDRLEQARRAQAGTGQEAMDRDLEVHRLTSRLHVLQRFGLDLCLGRMDPADGREPSYVGRVGLTDASGARLLVDWRSRAAEPFFGATHGDPMGLAGRRRFRWTDGRVTDFWDEVFTAEGLDAAGETRGALDDQSAFIASLGASRSGRMRDVLGTIQADQDAIVRAGSRGALVVDGGPGTGKTVVALHRTAYLLYSDPRLDRSHGGVLFVGPHRPYLTYVADVLPSLGEDGVLTCTLRDLVPEGAGAAEEPDHRVVDLKASRRLLEAVEPAVRLYEEAPTEGMEVSTPWADVWVSPHDWAEAFAAPDPGTPHNNARDQVWDELLSILADKVDDEDVPRDHLVRALAQSSALVDAFGGAWPTLAAADLVGDLWSVPAYLRRCAPWLAEDEVQLLQRSRPQAWTVSDLPLLDAVHRRLGDPEASRRRRRAAARQAREVAEMDEVVDHLIATDDSDMKVMSMLRGGDLRSALVDWTLADADVDPLAGPFAHVVVDEAQELDDAQWQMLLDRCPSRSLTIVGDRAQARRAFGETWEERLRRVGLDHVEVASLTVNYRTPTEVMSEAEPVIRAALPDANVPTSVRSTGVPVRHASLAELGTVATEWLASYDDGTACVISALDLPEEAVPDSPRVRVLTPELTKGLEFDLVVLVQPESWPAVDRYVAMTRATYALVVLT